MERRLLRLIINPAMMVSCCLGLGGPGGVDRSGWFHAKLLLVIGLSACTACWRAGCVASPPTQSARRDFFRVVNEIPALLMIGIVILVVVKPFYRHPAFAALERRSKHCIILLAYSPKAGRRFSGSGP